MDQFKKSHNLYNNSVLFSGPTKSERAIAHHSALIYPDLAVHFYLLVSTAVSMRLLTKYTQTRLLALKVF